MKIDYNYIAHCVNSYNRQQSDLSLLVIASHVDLFDGAELTTIHYKQALQLTPLQRYTVLNWLCCNDFEIKGDLALLIFGRQQLEEWLERSQAAYPHFRFFLAFEYQTQFKSDMEDGINFAMYWEPLPSAPMPLPETEIDFPWRSFWDSGEMFWGDRPDGSTNDFEFTLNCYPNEASFTNPNWICEQGDWCTTPSEPDLMSVEQVLEQFAVRA